MPSRREHIRMLPGEIYDYLREQRKVIVVTNGADGLPHAVPMHYGLDDENRLLAITFRKSQKVRNLERDPRATLLVESGAVYGALKSVMAYCDAEIIGDPSQVRELLGLIRADQTMAASLSEEMSRQIKDSVSKRVILRFSPFRLVTWDHGKLGNFY